MEVFPAMVESMQSGYSSANTHTHMVVCACVCSSVTRKRSLSSFDLFFNRKKEKRR